MIELVGTLVTAYGLLYAYGRTQGWAAQIGDWWAKIRGISPRKHTGAAFGSAGTLSVTAVGYEPLTLDAKLPLPEQLAQVENHVNKLGLRFGPLQADIARLDRAIEQAKVHGDTVATQVLADAKREIQRFGDRLDELQAIDLTWAVRGVLITALGVFLSFWA